MNSEQELIKLNEFDYINASPYEVDEVYKYTNYDKNNYYYSLINHILTVRLAPKRVVLSWNSPRELKVHHAIVELSLNADMSDSTTFITNRYHLQTYNLLTDTRYYWRVTLVCEDKGNIISKISTFKTNKGRRVLRFEGVENARDLGGMESIDGARLRQGLLFRTGEMDSDHQITDDGIKAAKELGIKTDLDLRKPLEINKEGIVPEYSPLGKDINYLHFSAHEYAAFLKGETNEKEILKIFADFSNYPILYHCKYGADRTGTLSFLLEALCGIDENDIAIDYELTQWRQRSYEKYRELVENFKMLDGESFQQKAYSFMKNKLGLTNMQISNIYNILMTDSAIFKKESLENIADNEIHIDLRKSKEIKAVLIDNTSVDFGFSKGILKLLSDCLVKNYGEIILDDGQKLYFN